VRKWIISHKKAPNATHLIAAQMSVRAISKCLMRRTTRAMIATAASRLIHHAKGAQIVIIAAITTMKKISIIHHPFVFGYAKKFQYQNLIIIIAYIYIKYKFPKISVTFYKYY
jgi:hypothetical protein